MRLSWVPEKEGNWLFHCHLQDHIMPQSFLREQPEDHAVMSLEKHAHEGMGGLIMGIHVTRDKKFKWPEIRKTPERELTLMVGEQPVNEVHNLNGKGFQLLEKGITISNQYMIPGPPIILTKDQPVSIKIINTMKEPTTIHWHGLEIESYFDGAAGWGTDGKKLAPLINPGDSFTVHLTPPRAGTFIYHTHMHDQQLLDGLYGALIVLGPGEKYDPATDKIILISQGGSNMSFTKDWTESFTNTKYLLNGSPDPEPINLKKGSRYRLRVISIPAQEGIYFTSREMGLYISLFSDNKPVKWKLLDIDGMNGSGNLHEIVVADRLRAGPGTTKDFEFIPDKPGDYRFDVKVDGKLKVSQKIKVEE
jgi:FtsP/CotA-like multicopper oxidase with cupredoxin domain